MEVIDVYSLPPVDNVCGQILREVISLPKCSVAHVIMNECNVSLLHQHARMSEVYFIIDGEGVLYHGDKAMNAKNGAYLMLPPKTPHKLRNTGSSVLEHLVIAMPPFDPKDVELLNDDEKGIVPETFVHDKPPITALDGALIYEVMSSKELDVGLAVGFLPARRKAIPHYHRISEEVYYICSGVGTIRVGEETADIKKGSVIFVPRNKVHALENKSGEELTVLCITSPAYSDGDFIFEE